MKKTNLAHGADVNIVSDTGTSPLMRAVKSYMPVIIHLLLQNGADKSKRHRDGHTAADLARELGYNDLAELIDNWQ